MQFLKKSATTKNKSKDIYMMLLPIVLCVCLCAACLVGSTFAWFTATQTSSTQVIQAANYDITVLLAESQTELTPENGIYSLESGKTYELTLTAIGTATTGYSKITLGDNDFYTVQMKPGESIKVTITANSDVTLENTPQWGTSASEAEKWGDNYSYTYNP